MDIDEAILHCEEVADRCMITDGNIKCGNDHRQLAEWLKDYKELKLLATAIKPKWKAEDRYVKNRFFMFPYCPKCSDEIMPRDCYCKFCGQHIDWSEDDE